MNERTLIFPDVSLDLAALQASHKELLSALKETLYQLVNSPVAWSEPIEKARLAIKNAEALKK